jgi:hypothetical protein
MPDDHDHDRRDTDRRDTLGWALVWISLAFVLWVLASCLSLGPQVHYRVLKIESCEFESGHCIAAVQPATLDDRRASEHDAPPDAALWSIGPLPTIRVLVEPATAKGSCVCRAIGSRRFTLNPCDCPAAMLPDDQDIIKPKSVPPIRLKRQWNQRSFSMTLLSYGQSGRSGTYWTEFVNNGGDLGAKNNVW